MQDLASYLLDGCGSSYIAGTGAAGLGDGGGAGELFSTGQDTWGWLPMGVDLLRREEQLLPYIPLLLYRPMATAVID